MPRTSKADAPVSLDQPEIEVRAAELDGYTVAFETDKADLNPAPLFQGLPEDRCQCPHWAWCCPAGSSSGTPATTRSTRPGTPTTARPLAESMAVVGQIAELAVYRTGDWDQARQAEHAAAVTLLRP